VRFQQEPFARWYPEAAALWRAHWELVGRHRDRIPLDVDVERWVNLEKVGAVLCFTARTGERLNGYAAYLTTTGLNYKSTRSAYCHAIYIDPRELTGLKAVRFARFINFCDAELKKRGCVKTTMHMKLTHDFGRMVARLGYEEAERLWERLL